MNTKWQKMLYLICCLNSLLTECNGFFGRFTLYQEQDYVLFGPSQRSITFRFSVFLTVWLRISLCLNIASVPMFRTNTIRNIVILSVRKSVAMVLMRETHSRNTCARNNQPSEYICFIKF